MKKGERRVEEQIIKVLQEIEARGERLLVQRLTGQMSPPPVMRTAKRVGVGRVDWFPVK